MNQLLDIKLSGIDCTEVRTDCLSLNGKFYFFVGNITAHGSVKLMRFTTTPGRWTTTAIEEDYFKTILSRNR